MIEDLSSSFSEKPRLRLGVALPLLLVAPVSASKPAKQFQWVDEFSLSPFKRIWDRILRH
jgi:hypothetical protein